MGFLDLYNRPFYNSAGESAPPWAIMQIGGGWTEANDRDYFSATKPDGNGRSYLINGPQTIAATKQGMATDQPGVYVRYTGSTPTPGDEWGPVSGSWDISSSGSGYLILGDVTTIGGVNVVRVAALGGGGSTTLTSGYLVNEIPAEDLLALCIKRDAWDPDVNWYTIEDEPSLGGINKTHTPIRGSEGVKIPVWGFIRLVTTIEDDIEVTREYLEIVHYDNASLPGHQTTTAGGKPQGPYHPSGSDAYRVDGGPCNTD